MSAINRNIKLQHVESQYISNQHPSIVMVWTRRDRHAVPAQATTVSVSRWGLTLVAVKVMMCWTSRQVRQGRTCSIRATMPAARGAAADVPVCPSVQPVPCCIDQSDVTCAWRARSWGPTKWGEIRSYVITFGMEWKQNTFQWKCSTEPKGGGVRSQLLKMWCSCPRTDPLGGPS